MGRKSATDGTRPRTGLVLGAGGVVGAAWMTGALSALQDHLPGPVNDVDVIVGTSAGSVLAAALRCGVTVQELVGYQRGEPMSVLAGADVPELDVARLPPPPRLRVGSPQLMLATLTMPHRVHPMVGASAWLPMGRARHDALRAMVDAMHDQTANGQRSRPNWVDRPTWIVAVDYDSGRRVVFGRPGAPPARLADAVTASCAIPGWYEPVIINGRRYVDGGIRSATSVSTLATYGLDEIYVLAPIASIVPDVPRKPYERLERRLRRIITRSLQRDVQALRALGVKITVLTPGPDDLATMGVNLMDSRRRAAVLETALLTSAATLAASPEGQPDAA